MYFITEATAQEASSSAFLTKAIHFTLFLNFPFKLMNTKNLFSLGTYFSLVKEEFMPKMNSEYGSDSNSVDNE